MQGKIIAEGLIGGTDGKRYTFTLDDLVKGTHITNAQHIIGNEVDFEVVEGKASNIYITKSSLTNNIYITKSSLSNKILSTDLQGIKLRVYRAMACVVISPVPFIGQIAVAAAIVLMFVVVWGVNTQSQSTTFKKNFLKTLVALVVGCSITYMITVGGILVGASLPKSSLPFEAILTISLYYLFFFLSWLPFLRYLYLCTKELAYITNQKMFLYAFWCCVPLVTSIILVTGIISVIFFVIVLVTGIIGVILSFIAWVRTQEIRKSYSALS